MDNFKELIQYAKKTEDNELTMIIKMVLQYKGKLPKLIQGIKDIHLTNGQKHKADMIYSTVHKCKGLEYDIVNIADDFMKQSDIKQAFEKNKERYTINKLNEEINLLYVAATRTKNKINIPDFLIPSNGSIITTTK